jgi:hypothetical protein
MLIEQTPTEIIIRVPADVQIDGLQRLIDFLQYRENVLKSKATQEEIDNLSSEINKDWWLKNKDKFIL